MTLRERLAELEDGYCLMIGGTVLEYAITQTSDVRVTKNGVLEIVNAHGRKTVCKCDEALLDSPEYALTIFTAVDFMGRSEVGTSSGKEKRQ